MTPLLRNLIILIVIMANVGCDQVTKHAARASLNEHEIKPVIGNHFVLTRVENTGAFLSLGADWTGAGKTLLISIFPLIGLALGLYYIFTNRNKIGMFIWGMAFVIGGGIGNLYDRLLYGSVTDFMHIDLSFARTGIFNMADVSIMVGTGLLIVNYLYSARMAKNKI